MVLSHNYISVGIFLLFNCFLTCPVFGQNVDSVLQFTHENILFVKPSLSNHTPAFTLTDTLAVSEKFLPDFDVVLHKLPGIFCLNSENKAQDLRINIRGYGSRAAFGIRGIKMYLDGIPLTSPDGTTQIDELSLFMLDQTQISTTNTSSILGNGGGGLMQFKSLPYEEGLGFFAKTNTYGSYDAGMQGGFSQGKGKHVFMLSHHRFQSLRQYAGGRNTILYNKNRWQLSPKWSVEGI